uniref:Uncharacterized protein n=1 Tax=Rhizophora mucronata TaxID=61149 RepID=A0A2P2Q5P0_RHIMU
MSPKDLTIMHKMRMLQRPQGYL